MPRTSPSCGGSSTKICCVSAPILRRKGKERTLAGATRRFLAGLIPFCFTPRPAPSYLDVHTYIPLLYLRCSILLTLVCVAGCWSALSVKLIDRLACPRMEPGFCTIRQRRLQVNSIAPALSMWVPDSLLDSERCHTQGRHHCCAALGFPPPLLPLLFRLFALFLSRSIYCGQQVNHMPS